jgi:hypothetical protein
MAGIARFNGWALKGVLVGMTARTVSVVAFMGGMAQAAGLHRYLARTILMILGSVMADFANILRTFLIYGSPVVTKNSDNIC